ncbi:MAG: hypothetical protein COV76_06410 [Candidatus Omnitrophica bacterium CG11_big_fil_rev_8_21_14_0_20_64_10]|nr:MAG: hypothetical protein COV76_06410 [Candidatus Omnitrophica bacterium CG11_big_fil_rev_8_21_14_0_20_64_10]
MLLLLTTAGLSPHLHFDHASQEHCFSCAAHTVSPEGVPPGPGAAPSFLVVARIPIPESGQFRPPFRITRTGRSPPAGSFSV